MIMTEADTREAAMLAHAARRRAERTAVARQSANNALSRAKDAAASLSAFRWSVERAQARVEQYAEEARFYLATLAELEPSESVDRAAAALVVSIGAPEAEVLRILALPETIRPQPVEA